jgi:hypothetical protein
LFGGLANYFPVASVNSMISIIPTIPFSAHASDHSKSPKSALMSFAGILATAVRMVFKVAPSITRCIPKIGVARKHHNAIRAIHEWYCASQLTPSSQID